MQPKVIACDTHDLIEIICMRQYQIQLQLEDGSLITGSAKTTKACDGQEYLQLQQTHQLLDVPLLHIVLIKVLTPGADPAQIRLHTTPGCP